MNNVLCNYVHICGVVVPDTSLASGAAARATSGALLPADGKNRDKDTSHAGKKHDETTCLSQWLTADVRGHFAGQTRPSAMRIQRKETM